MKRRLSVFLCHASEDKSAVREIDHRLRQDGFEPWLDEDQLKPGQDWDFEINRALRRADAVVVCLTKESISKEGYLQKELRQALGIAEEKPDGTVFIIPVKLEPCEIPERIARWQWAAYYEPEGYDRLATALQLRAASLGLSTVSGERRPRLLRRFRGWTLTLAWSLGIFAIGVGVWGVFRAVTSQSPKPVGPTVTPPAGMVLIPAGVFVMGRDHASFPIEGPAHKVSVRQFYLDRRMVSNSQYRTFVEAAHRTPPQHWKKGFPSPSQQDLPVTWVSWTDALAYCQASGNKLPTEAEWEYAARGGEPRLYPWGDEFRPQLVNSLESGTSRVLAGGRNSSRFGVEDMSGNVWQWCADDFRPYPGAKLEQPYPEGAKVIRGGSFRSDRDHVTTTVRNIERSYARSDAIGFRCAR